MSAIRKPLVSVIIPVFNDGARLMLCLNALADQKIDLSEMEVIVADNGSSPAIVIDRNLPYKLRVIRCVEPGSYAARNSAISDARGSFFAFTDADCKPNPLWLKAAIEYFHAHPDVGAVGGGIILELSDRATSSELYERIFSLRQRKSVLESGFAFTANLIVRREAFFGTGLFNKEVRSGGDRDWGQRFKLAGGQMDYVRLASVCHPARATFAALMHKRRRLEGGRRVVPKLKSLNATWRNKPSAGYPRGAGMGLSLIFSPRELGLTRFQGVRVLVVALMLVIVGWAERARLRLGGEPLR